MTLGWTVIMDYGYARDVQEYIYAVGMYVYVQLL